MREGQAELIECIQQSSCYQTHLKWNTHCSQFTRTTIGMVQWRQITTTTKISHRHTHTFRYGFMTPFFLLFTLYLNLAYPLLYLHLNSNKDHHDVLQKPWKSRIPSVPFNTTHRFVESLKTTKEQSVCVGAGVWLSHLYSWVPWTNLDARTHAHTHTPIDSIPSTATQWYILWLSSKGDRKSMFLLLTSEHASHL